MANLPDNKITPCSNETLGAMQYTLSKLPAERVSVHLQSCNKVLNTVILLYLIYTSIWSQLRYF